MRHAREGFERTAMAAPMDVPSRDKARAGRTSTSATPVIVRSHHVTIDQHHRDYVREKLGLKLGKFAPSIERIHVRFDDVNGPKGGPDHACRIQVSLSGMGVVVVTEVDPDAITAFDIAEDRLVRAIEHRIGRVREGHIPAQRKSRNRARAALPTLLEERGSKIETTRIDPRPIVDGPLPRKARWVPRTR
jgi:ribosome-associated translation inhibitor RaiA